MPTTESLLHAWGLWSRIEVNVGPDDAACGSAESAFRSPQCWDATRAPRVVVIPDDQALRIERCVVATGPIMAAMLRHHYIRRLPLRGRGEHALLAESIRRCGELLIASETAQNRRQSAAEEGHATHTSPAQF